MEDREIRQGEEEVREEETTGCKRLDEREGKLKGKEGGGMNGECGKGRHG